MGRAAPSTLMYGRIWVDLVGAGVRKYKMARYWAQVDFVMFGVAQPSGYVFDAPPFYTYLGEPPPPPPTIGIPYDMARYAEDGPARFPAQYIWIFLILDGIDPA